MTSGPFMLTESMTGVAAQWLTGGGAGTHRAFSEGHFPVDHGKADTLGLLDYAAKDDLVDSSINYEDSKTIARLLDATDLLDYLNI